MPQRPDLVAPPKPLLSDDAAGALPAPITWFDGFPGFDHDNRLFVSAFLISIAVHLMILAIRFHPFDLSRMLDRNPPLEVALVNAKSKAKPAKADILAQANLDGGGNMDAERRANTPLPPLQKDSTSQEIAATTQKVDAIEQQTKELISRLNSVPVAPPTPTPTPGPDARDLPSTRVIGGTIDKVGSFKFKATRVGSDTTLNQIIKMVEEAQASTANIQRIADKVASYFVPAVISVAFFSAAGWSLYGNYTSALLSFVAVLIIACPCALGIATPAALMVGVGKGAELGILIRGAEYLERAEKLNAVVFDKTGTLTKGEPEVTGIITFDLREEDLLLYAATAEKGSEHPLAEAILRKAEWQGIQSPMRKHSKL